MRFMKKGATRRSRTALLSVAVLLALLLTACGGGSGLPSGTGEKVINMAYTTAWGSLIPYYSSSTTMYELSLFDKIYDKLVFTDMAGTEILPRAADSWESVDDGMGVVFHLNENARWSDGESATADDWVFTVELLADPDSAFNTRVLTQDLAGTDENGVRIPGETLGVEAPDSTTLKFTFKKPTDPADFLLSYNRKFLVLPRHLLGDIAPAAILESSYWNQPVGSGPCVYVSQVMGSEVTLIPNPYYHLWSGNWDKLVLRVIDSASRVGLLLSEGIDLIELGTTINPSDIPVAEAAGMDVEAGPVKNFFMEVLLNENSFPDQRIRQALHYAVDKDAIVQAAVLDTGTEAYRAAYSYELQNSDYDDPSLAISRDVEKAKALLAEAGYNGETFDFAYAFKRENIAVLLVQQWEEAGIHVNPQVVDVAAMFSGLAAGTYDIGLSGHSASAYPLWFEAEFPANSSSAAYTPDPVRKDYVERISSTVDHAEKVALVKEYQAYLAEKTWFLPIYLAGEYWVAPVRVHGVRGTASLMCNDNVWEWTVDD